MSVKENILQQTKFNYTIYKKNHSLKIPTLGYPDLSWSMFITY